MAKNKNPPIPLKIKRKQPTGIKLVPTEPAREPYLNGGVGIINGPSNTHAPVLAAQPGDEMTLTPAYDAAKTASQPGDPMTLTPAYNAAMTSAQPGDPMTLTAAYDPAKAAVAVTQVDFWSASPPLAVATITAAGTDVTLGSITLPNISTYGVVLAAYLMVKYDKRKNTHAGDDNMLNGPQNIEISKTVAGAYIPAIVLPNNGMDTLDESEGPGDAIMGGVDIKAQIASGAQSDVKLALGDADYANLELHDVQIGIRITFRGA